MIRYALVCEAGHGFDAWFRNAATADEQLAAGMVACALCSTPKTAKAPMAPAVMTRRAVPPAPPPAAAPVVPAGEIVPAAAPALAAQALAAGSTGAELAGEKAAWEKAAQLMGELRALRRAVEAKSTDVGPRFAEEARRMHYGEAEAKPIRGRTTEAEAEALAEEGVPFAVIPWIPLADN